MSANFVGAEEYIRKNKFQPQILIPYIASFFLLAYGLADSFIHRKQQFFHAKDKQTTYHNTKNTGLYQLLVLTFHGNWTPYNGGLLSVKYSGKTPYIFYSMVLEVLSNGPEILMLLTVPS